MKRILLLSCLLLTFCTYLHAQRDTRYTQYMFNQQMLNPGYTGSTESLSFTGIGRLQWVGIEGAPKSVGLSAHSPLGKQKKFGVGGYIAYDKIGVHNQTSAYASYAYKFILGESRLVIGLQGGIDYLRSDFTQVTGNENIDITIDNAFADNQRNLLPNFGLGLYFYKPNVYYLGVSAPHLLNNNLRSDSGVETLAHQYRHYYAMGGVVIGNGDFKVRPSFLVKSVPSQAPVQLDASLLFLIKEVVWFGASYRTAFGNKDPFAQSESIDAIIAFQLPKGLKLGYAYDYTLSKLNNYTSGSHEVMVGLDIKGRTDRFITPRYF
ncbi:MAG: type IX secretion system membrane protein PorP/SprF [Sphingobacteriales bacterium]|nr:MAG: type IX secretion system membrane protein PorP/SprF [Sphingobacteriales bacterium]